MVACDDGFAILGRVPQAGHVATGRRQIGATDRTTCLFLPSFPVDPHNGLRTSGYGLRTDACSLRYISGPYSQAAVEERARRLRTGHQSQVFLEYRPSIRAALSMSELVEVSLTGTEMQLLWRTCHV